MGNFEISKRKWKYLSFALMGTILVGVTMQQANAATDISQLPQQILNIVKSSVYGNEAIKNQVDTKASQTSVDTANSKLDSLQTDLNTIDTSNLDVAVSTRASQITADAIKAKTDNLPSKFSAPRSFAVNTSIDPADGDTAVVVLTPSESNTIFSGTAFISYKTTGKSDILLKCNPSLSLGDFLGLMSGPTVGSFNVPFACQTLYIQVTDVKDGTEAPAYTVVGSIQFTSSEIEHTVS